MSFAMKDLETDSASHEAVQFSPESASSRKTKPVKDKPMRQAQMITINRDEYDLLQGTIRRQEGTIVNLRQVYESDITNKERELQIATEKAKKMEQALNGTEKHLENVVRLQVAQLGKSKGEHSAIPVQVSQSGENLRSRSSPVELVEQAHPLTKLDRGVPKADTHPLDLADMKAPCHLGTPCAAFEKVVQENRRLKKLCQELMSSNGKTTTITLNSQEYEEVITKLKQEVMQVKLELQNTRTSLILRENGTPDPLAEKLVELQREKVKLSKLVVTKASLLSIYNKEYERLKEAYNQLQQKLSEKDNVESDTRKLVERQPGDGMEMGLDTTESAAHKELMKLQVKHAAEVDRLNREKQLIQEEMIRLTCLNKTYAESIEELRRTRRTVDEQPMSMGDMRKELEQLREERVNYADDIKKYTQKMDEMDREIRTKDANLLKQKQFYDQQQAQYRRLREENTKLQRQLDEVSRHNKQLKYQCSRSPQTSTESQGSLDDASKYTQLQFQGSRSPHTSTESSGSRSRLSPLLRQGIIAADGVDEEEELRCPRCDREFTNPGDLKAHERKCTDF